MHCQRCRAKICAGAEYCGDCGYPVTFVEETATIEQAKTLLLVGSVIHLTVCTTIPILLFGSFAHFAVHITGVVFSIGGLTRLWAEQPISHTLRILKVVLIVLIPIFALVFSVSGYFQVRNLVQANRAPKGESGNLGGKVEP